MAKYTKKLEELHDAIVKADIKGKKPALKELLVFIGKLFNKKKIRKNTAIKLILDIEKYKLSKKVPFLQITLLTKELKNDVDHVGGTIKEKWRKLSELIGNL